MEYGYACISASNCFLYSLLNTTFDQAVSNTLPEDDIDHHYTLLMPGRITSKTYDSYNKQTYTSTFSINASSSNGIELRYNSSNATTTLTVDSRGIIFTDLANNISQLRLSDIINDIKTLQTQVAELQAQLAAKANITNPSFTGKVSITSE